MAPREEIWIEHQSPAGPVVTGVRGSLVVSSLQTLRELGLFDRYVRELPPEHQDAIVFALAASWLPVDLVLTHYGACEAMGLPNEELESIGQHVSARIMGTFLGTITRAARSAGGASPAVALKQYDKLWDRLLRGGGCSVRETGPKDVLIESHGMPMFRYRYFRVAYVGLVRGACLMFSKACYVRTRRSTEDTLTLSLSWV